MIMPCLSIHIGSTCHENKRSLSNGKQIQIKVMSDNKLALTWQAETMLQHLMHNHHANFVHRHILPIITGLA